MVQQPSHGGGRPGLWYRSCACVRRIAWGLLVIAALLSLAGVYVLQQVDERIRGEIETAVARQFPEFTVHVGAARRIQQGIEVRDLRILDPRLADAEMLSVDLVEFQCSSRLADLVSGPPDLRAIVVRRPTFHLRRDAAGEWDLRLLKVDQSEGNKLQCPRKIVEDATLLFHDGLRPEAEPLALRDIDLSLIRDAETVDDQVQFSAKVGSEHFRMLQFQGRLDNQTGAWSTSGSVSDLRLSSDLLAVLPGPWGKQLEALATLRARADLDFQVRQSAGEPSPRFVVSGKLSEGRFEDRRLPYPLSDLQAILYCDNQGLKVDELTARSGQTRLSLALSWEGFTPQSPYTLRARVKQLTLDQRLFDALPDDAQRAWNNYSPSGVIDCDVSLRFDGKELSRHLVLTCHELSVTPTAFPYQVHQATGTVRLDNDELRVDEFIVRAGGQPIRLDSRIHQPGPHWTGWMKATGEGPLPIEEKLLTAVDRVVPKNGLRALRPSGQVALTQLHIRRSDPESQPVMDLDLQLSNGSIRHKAFPYPVSSINGQIKLQEGRWTFRDLNGRNDSGFIKCQGSFTPQQGRGGMLELEFDCRAIPLEDELRDALNRAGQEAWAAVRPRGTLDQLGVRLRYDASRDQLDLDVRGVKWPADQNVPGRSITISPAAFPYRLDDVTGSFHFHDGLVDLLNVRGVHGRSRVHLEGRFQPLAGKGWNLHFNQLTASGLRADNDFLTALPRPLARALEGLHLRGTLNVQPGDPRSTGPCLQLTSPAPGEPIVGSWDLLCDLEDGAIQQGVELEHIRGGVRLMGGIDQRGLQCRGDLLIDSLTYQQKQITQIRGPLWIDSGRVLFGSWADSGNGKPRQVTGQVFGGQLAGDARITLQEDSPFVLHVGLSNADLADIARQHEVKQRISGRANAILELRGSAAGSHTFRGDGIVRLNNADIYELPVMVALLKLLTIREPDKTAFTSSEIDFKIQGEHIYLDPINFRGDAVSLIGKGWMDLQRNINLKFYTQVGRRDPIRFLRPVLAEASRNILEIEVVGTLDNPHVNGTAFPEVDETLQRIFASPPGSGPLPWSRLFGGPAKTSNNASPPRNAPSRNVPTRSTASGRYPPRS